MRACVTCCLKSVLCKMKRIYCLFIIFLLLTIRFEFDGSEACSVERITAHTPNSDAVLGRKVSDGGTEHYIGRKREESCRW